MKFDFFDDFGKIASDTLNKAGELAQGTAKVVGNVTIATVDKGKELVDSTIETVQKIELPQISQDDMMNLLSSCYEGAINGTPGSKNCEDLAKEYLEKYNDVKTVANKFIDWQVTKCATSGFVTGLGGLITLPVTIPANIASVLYVQMRMIGTLAVMGGYNLQDDEVQTLVYLCLVKVSITDICKQTGIKIANKISLSLLKKLPGTVLTKINQKVGFRLVTKFGEKGAINLWKVVPVVGGVVGGGIDYFDTKDIANKSYKLFIDNEIE